MKKTSTVFWIHHIKPGGERLTELYTTDVAMVARLRELLLFAGDFLADWDGKQQLTQKEVWTFDDVRRAFDQIVGWPDIGDFYVWWGDQALIGPIAPIKLHWLVVRNLGGDLIHMELFSSNSQRDDTLKTLLDIHLDDQFEINWSKYRDVWAVLDQLTDEYHAPFVVERGTQTVFT